MKPSIKPGFFWFSFALYFLVLHTPTAQAQQFMRFLLQGNRNPLIQKTTNDPWQEQHNRVVAEQEHWLKHEPSIRQNLERQIAQYQETITSARNNLQQPNVSISAKTQKQLSLLIQLADRCVELLRRVKLAHSSQHHNLQSLRLALQQMMEAKTQLRHLLQKNYRTQNYQNLRKEWVHAQRLLRQTRDDLRQTHKDLGIIDTTLHQYQSRFNQMRRALLRVPTVPVPTTTTTKPVILSEDERQYRQWLWREQTLRFDVIRTHIRLLQVQRDDQRWERDTLQIRTQLYAFIAQEMNRRLKSLSQQVKGGFLFYRPLGFTWDTLEHAWIHTKSQWQQGWPSWQTALDRALYRWNTIRWGISFLFFIGWVLLWLCLRILRHFVAKPLEKFTEDANQATVTRALWRSFQVSLGVLHDLLPFLTWIITPLWIVYLLFGSHDQVSFWLSWTGLFLLWYTLWILARMLFHPQAQHEALPGIRSQSKTYILLWIRTLLLFALFGSVVLLLLQELSYPAAFRELIFACVASILTICLLGILYQRDIILTLLPTRTSLERFLLILCYQGYFLFFLIPLTGLGLFLSGYQNLAFYLLRSLGGTFLCLLVFILTHEIIQATLLWFFGFSTYKTGILREMNRERALQTMRILRLLLTGLLFLVTLGMIFVVWQVPQGFGVLTQIANFPLFQTKDVSISLLSFAKLFLLIAIAVWASHFIPQFLQEYIYPNYNITEAVQYAISTLLRYLFITLGCLLGLQWMGVGWGSITLFLGILAIGLGFGLQDIFGNFVSGLIILFGRPFAVGDYLEVGDKKGKVREITVRSTTIQTPLGRMILIPNSTLLNAQVINWSLYRSYIRDVVIINVAHGTDIKKMERILLEIALLHPQILPKPEPSVRLRELKDQGMEIGLTITLRDAMTSPRIFNDLRREIVRRFREEGIEIAHAQPTILFNEALEDVLLQKLQETSCNTNPTTPTTDNTDKADKADKKSPPDKTGS